MKLVSSHPLKPLAAYTRGMLQATNSLAADVQSCKIMSQAISSNCSIMAAYCDDPAASWSPVSCLQVSTDQHIPDQDCGPHSARLHWRDAICSEHTGYSL